MTSKFVLEIDLGNDAMKTPADIAQALFKAAEELLAGKGSRPIYDLNGNRVGQYQVKPKEV